MTQRTKKTTEIETDVAQHPKTWRMEIPSTTKEVSVTENAPVKKMFNIVYILVCCIILYKLGDSLYNKKKANDLMKKNVACPALLSVTRSARDTLIVMKAEHLCNDYVLENLK